MADGRIEVGTCLCLPSGVTLPPDVKNSKLASCFQTGFQMCQLFGTVGAPQTYRMDGTRPILQFRLERQRMAAK